MKITLAQINPTIGDFQGNLGKIEKTLKAVQKEKPDLAVFSELILSGYPPQDLLERQSFLQQCKHAQSDLAALSTHFSETAILFGNVSPTGKKVGKGIYNSAFLVQNGCVLFQQNKSLLPTYDVFDESRYFDPAGEIHVFDFKGEHLGITICEDAWNDPDLFPQNLYPVNPVALLAEKGATLFINISASPFGIGKEELRHRLFRNHVLKHGKPFFMLNQVGANDELISDGRSMAFDGQGRLAALLPAFREETKTIDLKKMPRTVAFTRQEEVPSVHDALVLGIRDYMRKCGFQKAVLGLSGGIDSALTCCLSAEAIGPENVLAVTMPSPYSSKASVEDARLLAENLKVAFDIIPIADMMDAYRQALESRFQGLSEDETEENIQARIRGNILMALSNKFGYLTLSSGNKSELSVGYCTLYGDMSGGLSVLADVPKTLVYRCAEYINRDQEIIPKSILQKEPSAELKPGQTDQDTLPPYDVLDAILNRYVDEGAAKEMIIKEGFPKETVAWVIQAVKNNEHKRRQAAPGLKITSKAFGIGRRMPVAAKFQE